MTVIFFYICILHTSHTENVYFNSLVTDVARVYIFQKQFIWSRMYFSFYNFSGNLILLNINILLLFLAFFSTRNFRMSMYSEHKTELAFLHLRAGWCTRQKKLRKCKQLKRYINKMVMLKKELEDRK